MLGHRLEDKALKDAIKLADPRGQKELDFEPFACFASKYVDVEEDAEAVAKELREAFLLYDRDCEYCVLAATVRGVILDRYYFLLNSDLFCSQGIHHGCRVATDPARDR